MEIGILVALLSAFMSSLRGSLRKHVSRDFSSIEIGFLGQVYGSVLLFPVAAWMYLEHGFVWNLGVLLALLVSAGVVISTTYLYIEALRISDLSVTEPLKQTAPLFVAVLEPIILSTSFRSTIALGAVLGTLGAYVMVTKDSFLKPVENIMDKGALLTLLVAFILSIWAIASRFGATNTNPLLFTYATYLVSLPGFWIWKKKNSEKTDPSDIFRKDVFALGTVTAVSAVIGIYAYSLISASEVTIVQQTSGIFGVIIGGRFFSETDLLKKLIGALIIVSGVVLIAL